MLWLRGSFNSTLKMTADDKAGTMTAELLKSTLFEDYEASWKVSAALQGSIHNCTCLTCPQQSLSIRV